MKAFPNLHWKAIENMSTEEVAELLNRSKVYIDFGNHPGKDRFPREAAISGCCIITGQRGAAANDIDVMIPRSYKFPDKTSSILFLSIASLSPVKSDSLTSIFPSITTASATI